MLIIEAMCVHHAPLLSMAIHSHLPLDGHIWSGCQLAAAGRLWSGLCVSVT